MMKKLFSSTCFLALALSVSAFAGKDDQQKALVPIPAAISPKLDLGHLQMNMESLFPELFAGSRYFQEWIKPYAMTVRENLKAKPKSLIMNNLKPYALKAKSYMESLVKKHPQVQFLIDEIDLKVKYGAIDYHWLSFLGMRLQAAISNPGPGTDMDNLEFSAFFRENWKSESLKIQQESRLAEDFGKLDFIGFIREELPQPIYVPFYGFNLAGIGVLIDGFLQGIYPYGAADIDENEADGLIWSQILFADHDWSHGVDDYEVWMSSVKKYMDNFDPSQFVPSGTLGYAPNLICDLAGVFACAKLELIRDTYRDLFNLYLSHYANPRDMQVFARAFIGFFRIVHENNHTFSPQHLDAKDFFKILSERIEEKPIDVESIFFSENRKKYFLKEDALKAIASEKDCYFQETGYSLMLGMKGNADLLKVAGIVIEEPVLTGDNEKDYLLAKDYVGKVLAEMFHCVKFFKETAISLIQERDEEGLSLQDRFHQKAVEIERKFNEQVSQEFRRQSADEQKRSQELYNKKEEEALFAGEPSGE